MRRKRIMIPYPADVVSEIDKMVNPGERTAFLVKLAEREIELHRQRNALRSASGAWKSQDHPELAQGTSDWVRTIRQESAKRFERIEQHRETDWVNPIRLYPLR